MSRRAGQRSHQERAKYLVPRKKHSANTSSDSTKPSTPWPRHQRIAAALASGAIRSARLFSSEFDRCRENWGLARVLARDFPAARLYRQGQICPNSAGTTTCRGWSGALLAMSAMTRRPIDPRKSSANRLNLKVLFDEIEKAHPTCLICCCKYLEDGYLTTPRAEKKMGLLTPLNHHDQQWCRQETRGQSVSMLEHR